MEILALFSFIFLLLFLYGLFAELLGRWSISGPMIFTTVGLLVGDRLSLEVLEIDGVALQLIGQIALISILFTDASEISLKDFFKVYRWPIRLLFVGLPITMVVGSFVALFIFDNQSIAALMIMAFILSPTDAALGQAVVKSPKVPQKIRETINVESGLNDGLVLPPILIAVVFLVGKDSALEVDKLAIYIAKQLLLAPLVGVVLGWVGGKLINWSNDRNYSNVVFQGIGVIAIAIVSFVISEHLGANGFIAAFVSGLVFQLNSHQATEAGKAFGEFLSQPLALFMFFVFGAAFVPHYSSFFNTPVIIYSILSLTVLRMVPVVFSLQGQSLLMREKVFVAWFGPRGIASILYLLMVYNMIGSSSELNPLFATVVLTVLMSIYLHGISAIPYVNWLSKKA